MSRYTTVSPASLTATSRAMSAEQFDQVVKAIVEGKYSWACVLILRCAGYNPAHYLPYRTYKRLIKENRLQPAETQNTQPSETAARPGQSLCMAAQPMPSRG
ncbi:HetP family heterocyst commitment protein [Nodosilinea sp. PGN35]|uniref:HetP family heterocyst commitment protein n=1 Tax=Nodosilinea sp. PGN35 TaxID=3020489 RepID=UPI0023B32469|nr:HetP family heterocyst commitment protein [Nodosilinea sp. TSF1-S3]MDF0367099.1 HetP family heterocyst commitment protein [Nodosilinea sp. TSF1-S3]